MIVLRSPYIGRARNDRLRDILRKCARANLSNLRRYAAVFLDNRARRICLWIPTERA